MKQALQRPLSARFGGQDLAARFALLIFGIAALTATRSFSFVHSVPDRSIPPIQPLIWLFHQADILFVPGGNRLSLAVLQQVQLISLVLALTCFFLAARSSIPVVLRKYHRPMASVAVGLAMLLSVLDLQGFLPYPITLGTEHYGNDAITVTACAAADTVRGRNTYPLFDVGRCFEQARPTGVQDDAVAGRAVQAHSILPVAPTTPDRIHAHAERAHQASSDVRVILQLSLGLVSGASSVLVAAHPRSDDPVFVMLCGAGGTGNMACPDARGPAHGRDCRMRERGTMADDHFRRHRRNVQPIGTGCLVDARAAMDVRAAHGPCMFGTPAGLVFLDLLPGADMEVEESARDVAAPGNRGRRLRGDEPTIRDRLARTMVCRRARANARSDVPARFWLYRAEHGRRGLVAARSSLAICGTGSGGSGGVTCLLLAYLPETPRHGTCTGAAGAAVCLAQPIQLFPAALTVGAVSGAG